MTDAPFPDDRERLAAEYALSLLEGEELLRAKGLMARDPDFAARVDAWQDRLGPLADQIGPVEPGPDMWQRIDQATGEEAPIAETIQLRQSLRRWKWTSGIAAAAAAILAFFAFVTMPGTAPVPLGEPPLAASIQIGDTPLRLGLTYLPERAAILVAADGLSADGVHDHELWLVPPEGAPQSLGVVVPGERRLVPVRADLAGQIHDGSDLVLTREPLGGAPQGGAAGPVVAEGRFTAT